MVQLYSIQLYLHATAYGDPIPSLHKRHSTKADTGTTLDGNMIGIQLYGKWGALD